MNSPNNEPDRSDNNIEGAINNLVSSVINKANEVSKGALDEAVNSAARALNTASEKINNTVNSKSERSRNAEYESPLKKEPASKPAPKPRVAPVHKSDKKQDKPVKYTRKPSAVPIYLAAGVWLFWSLSGRMVMIHDFLLLAGISLGVYWIAKKIFRGKKIPAEAPKEIEKVAESGDPTLDKLLEEGRLGCSELGRLRRSILDDEICAKIMQIELVTQKILDNAKNDRRDIAKSRRFLSYYLPTTLKLLNTYDRMSEIEGDNANNTVKRIENMLDDIITAFSKHYDSMFSDEALDIETDIRVLEATMKKEGLL